MTLLDQILEDTWKEGDNYRKVKDVLGMKGAYPRWIGVANLTRTLPSGEVKSISSIMHVGD